MESIRKCLTIILLILVLGFIAYKTDLLKCAKKLTKSSGSVSSLYDTNLEYNKQLDNIKNNIEKHTRSEVLSSFNNTNKLRLHITKNMNNITKNIDDNELIPKNLNLNRSSVKNNIQDIKPNQDPINGSKIKNFNNNITNIGNWFSNDTNNLKPVSTSDDWHN